MEVAVRDVEAGDGRRHVVVERDDADAEDLRGGPRRRGLRRGGRHGRRRGRRSGWAAVFMWGGGLRLLPEHAARSTWFEGSPSVAVESTSWDFKDHGPQIWSVWARHILSPNLEHWAGLSMG